MAKGAKLGLPYGLGRSMKVFGSTKKDVKAKCKDRASGTDKRSVPSTVQPNPIDHSSGTA